MTAPSPNELLAENARLRELVDRYKEKIDRLERANLSLTQQLLELRNKFDELQRQQKRQAAPFSKGPPKSEPKTPGRKPGDAYGRKAFRAAPQSHTITEDYDVHLPEACSHCGSREIHESHTAQQFQVDLPRQPIVRRFRLHIGRCGRCGKRVQPRHALQTSDALGAARSQLGPALQALLTVLQKQLGLAHGKCVRLLQTVWGIRLTRGGVVQALQRMAKRVAPAVEQIRQAVRASPEVAVDETGWRIGGRSAWLHVQATDQAVSYLIDRTRAGEVAARVLGWDYAGTLVHDGWQAYDNFRHARHQQCLAHVLRRCRELLELASKATALFPQAVKTWLQEALARRDLVQAGASSARYLDVWASLHEERLRELLQPPRRNPDNRRLRKFLLRNLSALLTFLKRFGVAATSWRAEQALRPAVVNRKVWGGNRTPAGALVQSVLMTVLATLDRQARPILEALIRTLCQGHLRLRLAA